MTVPTTDSEQQESPSEDNRTGTMHIELMEDGTRMVVDSDGKAITNQVVTIADAKYITNAEGAIVQSAFSTPKKGKKVYSNKNGVVVTKGNVKYYCNKNGVITKVKKL